MWFRIIIFFKFLFKSSNQHGVHSPFVYNLVTKCFYKKTNAKTFQNINNIRNYLKNNESYINVTDFGKGSTIFKSNKRKISDIVKVAGISTKKTKLLINIIEYFLPSNILEIGTSVGLSVATISISNPKSTITTLEGCKETSAVAKNVLKKHNLNNINLIEGEFKNTLPLVLENNTFDFIYIDGNHQKEITLNYFEQCVKSINNNSFIIFDDINWSKEMFEAWEQIKTHSKVTISIDLYFWGIVFFRKEQAKQHFTIRT